MIKNQYVSDAEGAMKFGDCISCGKGSKEDPKMIRLIFFSDENSQFSICLCDECRQLLYKTI